MWIPILAFFLISVVHSCSVGEKKKDSGYEYTCVQDEDGFSYFQTTACISEGKTYNPGANVENAYFSYECKSAVDGGVFLEMKGCKNDGQVVPAGSKVKIGDYMWMCTKDTQYGFLTLTPSGCIVENGEIPFGKDFEEGVFWYTCTKTATSPIVKKIGGCIDGGKRLASGATYFKNGFVVTCQCNNGGGRMDGCSHKVTGCVEEGPAAPKAHMVGESWLQGTAPFRYTVKCGTCTTGSVITKTLDYCTHEGSTKIDPGCVKIIGEKLVACGINEKQTLQIYNDSAQELAKFTAKGYRSYC